MMENQASVMVNGQSVIAKECQKCGRKKARGVYMIREQDGRHIFKCDICGQKRSMGWTEASSLLMVEEKQGFQRAMDNRERWRREFTEKFSEDFEEATENLETQPDAVNNFDEMLRGPKLDNESSLGENDNDG